MDDLYPYRSEAKSYSDSMIDDESGDMRCWRCHGLTCWAGHCIHCGIELFPYDGEPLPLRCDSRGVLAVIERWPALVTFTDTFLEAVKPIYVQWESSWSIRLSLVNGWAIYALSTVSKKRHVCIGRLVDSELSCIVPA